MAVPQPSRDPTQADSSSAEPATTLPPAGIRAVPDVWSRAWRAAGGRLALVWVIPALLASGLSVILPQMPSAAVADQAARELWLAGIGGQFGPASGILAGTGLFAIEEAPGYRLLLAASLFSALVALHEGARRLHTAWPRLALQQAESFFGPPNVHDVRQVTATPQATLDRLAQRLTRRGFRVTRGRGAAAEYLAADRVAGHVGRLMAGAGLVLLVAGAGWTAWQVWRGVVVLAAGQSSMLSPVSGNDVLRLDRFVDGRADVTLDRAGHGTSQAEVGTRLPAWLGDWLVRLDGSGPALRVAGEDRNGQPLQLTGCPTCTPALAVTLVLAPDVPERSAFAPAVSLVVAAEPVPGRESAAQVSVFAGASDRPILSEVVEGERELPVQGAVLHVAVARYAQFAVHRAPGLALAVAGAVLAAVGGLLMLALPPWRVWALAAPEGGATVVKIATDDAGGVRSIQRLAKAVADVRGPALSP